MDYKAKSMEDWTESDVSQWLHSIRLKKEYIDKLFDEEVSGTVLKEIDEQFLKKISMKQGPIQLLLKKRDEIILEFNGSRAGPSEQNTSASQSPLQVADKSSTKPLIDLQDSIETTNVNAGNSVNAESSNNSQKKQTRSDIKDVHEPGAHKEQQTAGPLSTSNFRPFDKEVVNFKYVKNQVLSPETGIIDMITPCHEYKSLATAAKLDRVRLQAKFASEVIRFGSACMNMRTNGTIHFGVMDSVENKGFQHGQIVGIPVNDKDVYVDALDYIEKCFNKEYQTIARSCIRPPKFIEVIEKDSNEQNFIVEVDVVPHSSAVKGMVFSVSLPKYNEKNNKVSQDKKTVYQRVGAKSESVSEENYVGFIQGLQKVDLEREKAELSLTCETATAENLRRKLVLLTRGKEFIDDTQWYILVTNKWESNHLEHLDFLLRFNIFCVFDFDANSDDTGLCLKYSEHHARNIHSLISYSNESGMSTSDLKKFLGLFDQTSWIFCNGRSKYLGGDQPCDENTWIKNKKKYLKKAVSLICDELFPKGCFMVLFLLLSPVEKPIVEAFHEFYAEMNGVEDIVCIAENRDHYEKWANLAQTSCNMEILGQKSIFGIQLSHIDATVQNMFPLTNYSRTLPVSSKGVCILEKPIEEKLHSLEVLCVNECNDKNLDLLSKEEIKEMEAAFYRGGKITWKHFWLAEQNKCGQFIEREACSKVQEILNDILHKNTVRLPVARIQIFHHPGSGGSTMARQVLWKNRKDLRCAIVKSSNLFSTVSQHAVKLREYEEENPNLCLPVLLLVEDCEDDFLDDLRHDLSEAMTMKKITSSKPCFILLSCKRSNAPEQHFKVPPFEKVAVTHKLSTKEKQEFSRKLDELKTEFENIEFLITFVLMSKEFDERYVTEFVQNVLRNIDHASDVTRLMRYVALLNCYVHNSYISLSHCEAFLGLGAYTKDQNSKLRQCNFNSCLTEQAKLLFIELKESTTYITSIHIIHPLIAKEVLNQLSGTRPQNEIAKDLLEEKVLLHHRFGRDEFLKFIRDLFLRRHRKSRGDSVDSFFSPLIEHVCKVDKEKAINLLKAAYERLDRDAYFAQQLARLHYTHEQFEEAKKWAEIAKSQLPNNSIILDTEGQVYKKWFHLIMDKRKSDLTPDEVVELIEIGLISMQCFRAAQKAAKSEMDSMNNSGYIAEVDIGCRLLHLLSIQACFSKNKDQECTELFDYLSSSYIPKEIEEPWFNLHGRLKGLYRNIYDALEWLADDVGYFQSDMVDSGEPTNKTEEHIHNPRLWLLKKTKVFAKYFSPENSLNNNIAPKSQLVRKMTIYKLGGGSTTSILSLLSDGNNKRAANKLENIIDLYPQDVTLERPDDLDLINYIMCHIALACVNPRCSKILPFQKLRELSKLFLNPRKTFPPSAYLLVFLLFWPDDQIDKKTDANKEILNVALNAAKRLHEIRIKNVPVRKKRTNVLFFHGHGNGFEKIKHRSTIEKLTAGPLNERRMKWDNGEVWDIDSVHRLLKAVPGWTENGKLYAHGHNNKQAIEILPLNYSSVPHGNENVTFYLAFSYIGPVAYNIQLKK